MNRVINISLVVIGIIFLATFPPLGVVILAAAGGSALAGQRKPKPRYNPVLMQKQAEQQQRARMAAYRSLP